jgi:hypothetical protein
MFFVTLSSPTNVTIDDGQAVGTIRDNDEAPTLLVADVTVTEGNSGSTPANFVVSLSAGSLRPITVVFTATNGTATGGSDFTSTSGSISFAVGETTKTVPVSVLGDVLAESTETFTLMLSNAVNATITDGTGVGTITNDDVAALTLVISPTTIAEGETAQATLTRNTQDLSLRTVSQESSNPSVATVPATVDFPAGQASVTFTVTAPENNTVVASQNATITARLTGFTTATASVRVTDTASVIVTPQTGLVTDEGGRTATFSVRLGAEPTADVTINVASPDPTEGTVTQTSLTFTPSNFGSEQVVVVTGVDDNATDGDQSFTIVTGATRSADPAFDGLDVPDVSVTNSDNDRANVLVSRNAIVTTEAGGSESFTVRLAAQPSGNVIVNLISSDPTEGQVQQATLTFTPANFDTPQPVTVRGIDDGDISYRITLRVSTDDTAFNGVTLPIITAVNRDNDTAGINISKTSVVVAEAGATDTFTVRLGTQPTGNVLIPLRVSPAQATLSATQLVFTPQNFGVAQTVTVRAIDDAIADGAVRFTITLGPAISNDRAFANLTPPIIDSVATDNDRPGITLSPLSLIMNEGETRTVNIRLTSQPTAPVTVTLQTTDATEARVQNSVVLNAFNFLNGVNVPITALRDNLLDGPKDLLIATQSLASSDRNYNIPNAAAFTDVRVQVRDVDRASIIVTPTVLSTNESGTSARFTVKLGVAAEGTVSVRVAASDLTEGRITTGSNLIFTQANALVPQTVTVTGVNDAIQDGDISYTVTTRAVAAGAAGAFNNVSGLNVRVTNVDNDDLTKPGISIDSPTEGRVFRSLSEISGTVSDNRGVTRVQVQVARLGEAGRATTYLQANGSFSSTPTTVNAVVAGESFSLRLPTLAVGRYRAQAQAFDAARNFSSVDSVNFAIDDVPVAVNITSPLNNGPVNSRTVVQGTVSVRNGTPILAARLLEGTRLIRNLTVTRSGTSFSTSAVGALSEGTFTIEVSARDAFNNTVTDSVTVVVDTTPPSSVTVTFPTSGQVVDNLFEIRGTVTNTTSGTPLRSVEISLKRRTDETFFNGTSFQAAPTRVIARVTGNTFVYTLPSGLPADPDPLNAVYSIQALAFDTAGNQTQTLPINIFLSSNRNTSGSTRPTTTTSASVATTAPSTLTLSTATATGDQVTLRFTGTVDAKSASDTASYSVSIAGQVVKLETAVSSGGTIVLSLPQDTAGVGDAVTVAYNLRDAQGRALQGKASATVR